MKKVVITIFLFSIAFGLYSQNKNEIRAINNYVTFVNESIHGLLIAHRLFEGYNQTVNKYVDLPEYKLNNYSNADLPDDIFQDPEGWFYASSNPYDLYQSAIRESVFIGAESKKLNDHITEIKELFGVINNKRIAIASMLENSDLSQSVNIQKVYSELETIVSIYDQFYKIYNAIDNHLQSVYVKERGKEKFAKTLFDFHAIVKVQLGKIRKQKSIRPEDLSTLNTKIIALEKVVIQGNPQVKKRILTNTSRLVRACQNYYNEKSVPIEYQLYGNHYHYHNVTLLNLINRYGNGYISEYNDLSQDQGWLKEFEIPHFYKVIYPKKLPKEKLSALDDNKLIALLNKKIEIPNASPKLIIKEKEIAKKSPKKKEILPPIAYNRGIVVHKEVIYVSADSFVLELYDHLIKDGDRVSIKVNDVWEYKNISLEKEPKKLTIHIKPGQQNYILIHADNTGYRPPNTIALAYTINGERKEINLQTDLQNSQMVEIKYNLN
ncbi:MAG: hypothetical protein V3V00_06735 [Saprospiraceae bacterium]